MTKQLGLVFSDDSDSDEKEVGNFTVVDEERLQKRWQMTRNWRDQTTTLMADKHAIFQPRGLITP